jgi:hypothetical protein
VVLGPEQARAGWVEEASVGEDDGDAAVEDSVAVEGLGVVGYWLRC